MGACRGSHKECSPQPPPALGGRREEGGGREGGRDAERTPKLREAAVRARQGFSLGAQRLHS